MQARGVVFSCSNLQGGPRGSHIEGEPRKSCSEKGQPVQAKPPVNQKMKTVATWKKRARKGPGKTSEKVEAASLTGVRKADAVAEAESFILKQKKGKWNDEGLLSSEVDKAVAVLQPTNPNEYLELKLSWTWELSASSGPLPLDKEKEAQTGFCHGNQTQCPSDGDYSCED